MLRSYSVIGLAIVATAGGWLGSTFGQPEGFVSVAAAEEEGAQSWGNLSGQFVYGGEPPAAEKLTLNKDVAFCAQFDTPSERLLVNKENRGIANVVLWLEKPRGKTPPIHESYAKTAEADVVLANDKCRFAPHVVTMRTTQKLLIKNDDAVAHKTAAYFKRNLPVHAVSAANTEDQRSVRRAEREPVKVSCSIHSWMTGWLLVQDHPYMAVTDDQGRFTIKNLPAGEWTFQVWHEIPEAVTTATSDGDAHTWEKGRLTVTIKPGENDFGTWTLDPELFQ